MPSAQRARSCSLQRSLQNGRHAGSTGCRRQKTHERARDIATWRLRTADLETAGRRQAFDASAGRDGIGSCWLPSPAWWRTSRAETMKMTSSAMLVAWSPMRSRWREIRIRSSAGSIVAGSCSM